MRTSILGLLLCSGRVAFAANTPPPVPYPEGYRDWKHVKSMVIQEGHALYGAFGGIHHIYANPAAERGYGKKPFEDGSVIVFELLEANAWGNAIQEGARKIVGVMHKDATRYARTGGWGFEGFKGDSRTERAVGANAFDACYGCHAPRKDADYTFSDIRR
ncbi:MAG: cytochrome P460 family protein [Pseudomonadota bacterium]|jgi:hypothetical protein